MISEYNESITDKNMLTQSSSFITSSQDQDDAETSYRDFCENTEKSLFTYEYSIISPKINKIYSFPSGYVTNGSKPECFAVRYDKSDNYIAGGYSSGHIVIYDVKTSTHLRCMKLSDYPISSFRWKTSIGKPVLIAVHADGKISQWDPISGKILKCIEEKDNFIMCLDYDMKGTTFATGGSDNSIRIYDDDTKTIITSMKSDLTNISHSNRVFSVCFGKSHNYENLLVTGGWDNTIKFYDVRKKAIINSIFGPHIVGDSIDIKGHLLLTGSTDIRDQIKIWDIRTLKVLEVVSYEPNSESNYSTNINSAQFSKDFDVLQGKSINTFACAGLKRNQMRIYAEDYDFLTNNKHKQRVPLFKVDNLSDCIYSLDYSHHSNTVSYGTGGLGCIVSIEFADNTEDN